MTTNEAVEYIESIIRDSLFFINNTTSNDDIIKRHTDKANEAMAIIKADLAGGYRHYQPLDPQENPGDHT